MVCLFFFKQKTAYEVRISDWSSDVCSSDLGRARTTVCHDEVSRLVRSGMRSAAQATPRALSQAARKPSRPCSARTCSMAAWSVFEEVAQRASATSPRPSSNRRSEEHTSELQSLMRISYAVLCLKKKKNKPK